MKTNLTSKAEGCKQNVPLVLHICLILKVHMHESKVGPKTRTETLETAFVLCTLCQLMSEITLNRN